MAAAATRVLETPRRAGDEASRIMARSVDAFCEVLEAADATCGIVLYDSEDVMLALQTTSKTVAVALVEKKAAKML